MNRKPRVLLIAEAANPEMVSVPLVGWSIARAIQQKADAHIVTQVRNREAFLRAGLVEGEDFTAIDSEAVARPLWKAASFLRMGKDKGWTTVQAISSISYRYFETLVWRRFRPGITAGEWDLVHRVTPLSPMAISSTARKCHKAGTPYILGPLNGGVPWPKGFDQERRREREWLSYVRGAYRLLPGRRSMLNASSAIMVGSRFMEREIPERLRTRTIYLPENAIDPARFTLRAQPPDEGPLRVAFVGRLVPLKGVDMLLKAAAPFLRDNAMRLEIVGDGPMRDDLQALARAEGIAEQVHFHGWTAHHEVQDILAGCHLLGFPSFREFGGGVVLEAMALGVPPLVIDYAGPGELVEDGITGFKVPLGSRDSIIAGLHSRLGALVADSSGLGPIGEAARTRVETRFTWAAKADQICTIYDWVLGHRPEKPDFF